MDLTPDEAAEVILIAHQRQDYKGCVCGWAELGKSHPGHQVAMLREAALINDALIGEQSGQALWDMLGAALWRSTRAQGDQPRTVEEGVGDNPEEQRPALQHQQRSEEERRRWECGVLVCLPTSPEPFPCNKVAGHSGPHRRAEEQR